MADDKILARIAGALSIAEDPRTTEAERDTAMRTAQRIASTYSIDLAVARSRTAKSKKRAAPTHRTVTLGEARKKGLRTYVELFMAIGRANDVTFNIAHNSTYVIVFGFEEDIALTEALYASLVVQMVHASDAYMKAGTYKDELVYRQVTRTWREPYGAGNMRTHQVKEWKHVPVGGSMARINFQQAFAARIGNRLTEAQQQAKTDAIEADREAAKAIMERTGIQSTGTDRQTGTELAIIEKSVEVKDYYKSHSNARGS